MARSIEPPEALDLAEALAGEDPGRAYYGEPSELADLDAFSSREADEGALLESEGELALVRDELEELAALEPPDPLQLARFAEADAPEDLLSRRHEGMDVDDLDALARGDEEAESRTSPDDEIDRGVEAMGG